jgi:hypothetical protein
MVALLPSYSFRCVWLCLPPNTPQAQAEAKAKAEAEASAKAEAAAKAQAAAEASAKAKATAEAEVSLGCWTALCNTGRSVRSVLSSSSAQY